MSHRTGTAQDSELRLLFCCFVLLCLTEWWKRRMMEEQQEVSLRCDL